MTRLPVIACSLDAAGQKQRLGDWSALLGQAVRREETPDGVRYWFLRGNALEERVRTLAAAEKECCPFLDFDVVRTGDEIELKVSAPPEAAAALRSVFSAG
jgi:MerR family transcriptional regulator, copper efflux regulator